eukprot:6195560-Pleurochrysis_carterae.AAC.1
MCRRTNEKKQDYPCSDRQRLPKRREYHRKTVALGWRKLISKKHLEIEIHWQGSEQSAENQPERPAQHGRTLCASVLAAASFLSAVPYAKLLVGRMRAGRHVLAAMPRRPRTRAYALRAPNRTRATMTSSVYLSFEPDHCSAALAQQLHAQPAHAADQMSSTPSIEHSQARPELAAVRLDSAPARKRGPAPTPSQPPRPQQRRR